MRIRIAIPFLAVLGGCLILVCPADAQLTQEWSYNLSSLGWYAYINKPVIVDDTGNAYVLSYAGDRISGARVTKIKPDSTIAWQVSFPDPGLYLNFFGRSPAGDLFVMGHHEGSSGRDESVVGIKINANGTLGWSQTITPAQAPYCASPQATVDNSGNLWVGFTETPVDSFCRDSLLNWNTAVKHHAVVHRIDGSSGASAEYSRVTGEPMQSVFQGRLEADGDGNVYAMIGIGDLCCNSLCQGCKDSCFTEAPGWKTDYRIQYYLHQLAGGGSAPVWLASSDDIMCSAAITAGINRELLIFRYEYHSPGPWWCYVWRYGRWQVSTSGETAQDFPYGPTTDYQGNVIMKHFLVSTKSPSSENVFETLVLDGATGATRWTIPDIAGPYGADRDGNIYIRSSTNTVRKYSAAGVEQWVCTTGVDYGQILHADTAGWFYFQNYGTLRRCRDTKELVIRDHWGDSLSSKQFDLIRVAPDRPVFTEDTLGRITTDANGRYAMSFVTSSTFEVALNNGDKDTVGIGDAIKIARVLDDSAAVKHPGVLGSMYSLHLDNMAIDSFSTVTFDTLTDESEQDIYLTHTEVRYNLLVSLDWDADQAYLDDLQESFRRMSNYLYDVSDGQIRLDTVVIYDDRQFWDQADIWIYAQNDVHPCAYVRGIDDPAAKTVSLPRKWFGDEALCRNLSYEEHPLVLADGLMYRTIAHELGHYALGYYDEYLFSVGERCPLVANYGFMDYQYDDGGTYASELSSSFRYTDAACRNTKQYTANNRCCWDQLEARFERRYGADDILSCIITPDDDERELYPGDDFLEGPNDYVDDPAFLDYNVGRLVIFPVTSTAPAPTVKTLNVQIMDNLSGLPAAAIAVVLRKGGLGLTLRDIPQGGASDLGLIYVLGAEDGDQIIAAGQVDVLGEEKSAGAYNWLYGEATVGLTGVSRLGNRFALSQQADSAVIEVQSVVGEFPLIFQPTLTADSIAFSAAYQTPFSTAPTLEYRPLGGTAGSRPLSTEGATYAVALPDSLGTGGSLIVWGPDDAAHTFPATAAYAVAGTGDHLIGPGGQVEVLLDSAAGQTASALLVSSSYPPLRTGLSDNAVQAGDVHSLAVEPGAVIENAALIIRYDDADLVVSASARGEESSLRIFRWDGAQWTQVGGQPDTAQNTVYGNITSGGVYAAFTTAAVLGIEDDEPDDALPYAFELSQNYPNPFNPVTVIEYSLPERSFVTIEVFNVLGQRIRTLVNESRAAGTHRIEWDATDDDGRPLSTGLYLYRFTAGEYVQTRKMLLLK